jgi:hypothetical protein
LTISDPSYYWIAKLFGGDAEEQAETAMNDIAPGILIVVLLVILGLMVFGIGRVFGIW